MNLLEANEDIDEATRIETGNSIEQRSREHSEQVIHIEEVIKAISHKNRDDQVCSR